jgi:hypothetical protein
MGNGQESGSLDAGDKAGSEGLVVLEIPDHLSIPFSKKRRRVVRRVSGQHAQERQNKRGERSAAGGCKREWRALVWAAE